MGQVLYRGTTTTEAIRRAILHSQESLRTLACRHGINPKTVAKWRKRRSVADLPTGPKTPRSTVLSVEEEKVIVAFRRHTLLPLDDCLYALQAPIPRLTRSSLHRCLERHGISRLPEMEKQQAHEEEIRALFSATFTSVELTYAALKASSISSWPSTHLAICRWSSLSNAPPPKTASIFPSGPGQSSTVSPPHRAYR
jgi:transposase-like protein